MNGFASPIHVSVFDSISINRDLSAEVIRTYTFENTQETKIGVEERIQDEEFDPPIVNFQCLDSTVPVEVLPLSEEPIYKVAWILNRHTLEPGERVYIKFSFVRPGFFRVVPPLIASFEYSSVGQVIYSAQLTSAFPSLFRLSSVTVEPNPLNSGQSSHDITQDGKLIVAPRRLSINKAGKLSLQIMSSPPSIETLPLPKILSSQARGAGVSIEDLTVIIVPHLLTDFLSFIDAMETIGLNPKHTFIVGIPYSMKDHVVVRLLHRGYNSIWAPSLYPFHNELHEAIKAAASSARAKAGKILIVEDGGYVIPTIHSDYPELIPSVIGAVEQTANGIWAYKAILKKKRKIKTMNVAECDLKKRRESPHIGDAVFRNTSNLLDQVKMSVRNKEVLVVGFGSTGSQIAKIFKKMEANVTVFDEIKKRRREAKLNGFHVPESLDAGIKGKFLVIGCTGKKSIGINSLLRADHQTLFVNASSKRLEVDHDELKNITERVETVAPFVTQYHLFNGKTITILADGFPVNFHGDSESVPDKELQFIYGLLFDSAVYVIQRPDLPVGIIAVPDEMQNKIESLHDALLS